MPYNKDADRYYPEPTEGQLSTMAQYKQMTEVIDKLMRAAAASNFTVLQLWNYLTTNATVQRYINEHPGPISIYRKQLVRNYLRDKIAGYINTLE